MAGLNFVNGAKSVVGMATQLDQNARANDANQRAQEQFDQAQGVDDSLRQGLANTTTGRNAGLVRQLSQTPGGGATALGLQQKDQATSDDMERKAMIAAATGDDITYNYWKQKAGLQIPPQIDADAKVRSTYARGALVAEKLYRGDPQKAQQFVLTFMQSGDLEDSIARTGAPRDKATYSATTLIQDGKRVLGLIDRVHGTVTVPQAPGGGAFEQPATGVGTGRGGRPSAKMELIQYYVDVLGMTPAQAAQTANAPATSPERAYQDTYKMVLQKELALLKTPQEAAQSAEYAAQKAAEMVRQSPLYSIGSSPITPSSGPAAPAVPQPQMPQSPVPTAPATPVQSGTIGLPPELTNEPDGTVVEDDQGNQYEKRGNSLIPLGN